MDNLNDLLKKDIKNLKKILEDLTNKKIGFDLTLIYGEDGNKQISSFSNLDNKMRALISSSLTNDLIKELENN